NPATPNPAPQQTIRTPPQDAQNHGKTQATQAFNTARMTSETPPHSPESRSVDGLKRATNACAQFEY
ncbi:hypothetical protein, partial [Agrobacterium sp. NPDC090273]|uniref:hypothetical protein n=1 Tax=Agrobacterium sp. NPDC090273 TaxID=3363919 RepID=UPI00383BF086